MARACRSARTTRCSSPAARTRARPAACCAPSPRKQRVFVEGLNIVKRHQRPRSMKDTQKGAQAGGIIEKEGPIDVSNVMLLDPTDNKPTRVGVRSSTTASASATRSAPATRSTSRTKTMEATDTEAQQRGAAAAAARALRERGRRPADREVRLLEPRCRCRASQKVTVNMGIGEAKQTTPVLEAATEQLATITGQRPNVRRARKSIANFKLREGMPVGVAVTLRGARMWEFLDRLSRSRSRGSATSAGSTRARSTAAATTRSASASS